MKIKTWKKQNKLQEVGEKIYRIFKPIPCGFETFIPTSTKFALGGLAVLFVVCLLTPGTNWLLIPAVGLVLK